MRKNKYRIAVIALAFIAQQVLADEYSIGNTRIAIKLPKGFSNCTELGEQVVSLVKGALPSQGYTTLVCFVSAADVTSTRKGKPSLSEYGLVEYQNATVRQAFGSSDVGAICDSIRGEFKAGERVDPTLSQQLDSLYLRKGINSKSTVVIKPLNVRQTSNSCMFSTLTKITSFANGQQRKGATLAARSFMVVKGRLVEFQMTKKIEGEIEDKVVAGFESRAVELREAVVEAN